MQRASDILRVAALMIGKHGPEAARCAEKRAADLKPDEPSAAASWELVSSAIRMMERPAK